MAASGFSSIDVVGLATATGAQIIEFNIATGVSSTRRRGEPKSTEIILELAGKSHAGQPLRTRHAVFHPQGAAPLTAIGVAMILERLTGIDGNIPTPVGSISHFRRATTPPILLGCRLAEEMSFRWKCSDHRA